MSSLHALKQIYPEVNKKWIELVLQYESRSNARQTSVNLHLHSVLALSVLEKYCASKKYLFLIGVIQL
jgi:hypothetical protein